MAQSDAEEISADSLTLRRWQDLAVPLSSDNYFNATAIATHFGKHPHEYIRLSRTREYLEALCREVNEQPTRTQRGGPCQGTWFHPRVMLDFSRWLDVHFAIWMDSWILELTRRDDKERLGAENAQEILQITESPRSGIAARQQAARPSPLYRFQLCILNEQDLQIALVQHVRRSHPRAVFVGGLCELIESPERRRVAVQLGYTTGQPDLLCLNGTAEHSGLALEFKHPGFALEDRPPSDRQREYHKCLEDLGWRVIVCNDVFQAAREVDFHMAKALRKCECCSALLTECELQEHLRRKRKRRASASGGQEARVSSQVDA